MMQRIVKLMVVVISILFLLFNTCSSNTEGGKLILYFSVLQIGNVTEMTAENYIDIYNDKPV